MTLVMGIVTLLGAGTLFLQLGALAQGSANIAVLIIAATVTAACIVYWNTERRKV